MKDACASFYPLPLNKIDAPVSKHKASNSSAVTGVDTFMGRISTLDGMILSAIE